MLHSLGRLTANELSLWFISRDDAGGGAPKKKISAPDGLQSVSISSAPNRGKDIWKFQKSN